MGVQNGDHWFYTTINKEPERLAGAAKFINTCGFLENGDWKLVDKFDHINLKEILIEGSAIFPKTIRHSNHG